MMPMRVSSAPGHASRLAMAQPDVTVVVPCFNAQRFVVAAVKSVLSQRESLEVIVVDDGSTDHSVDVLRDSGLPIQIVEQSNQGVSAARNAGVARARGRWIAFVDADDVWLPGKLAAQRRLLADHPEARMAYTGWHVWHSDEPEPDADLLEQLRQQHDAAQWLGPSGWIYPDLLVDCVVWTSTVLVQRELLESTGGFDVGLRIGEDYDLWLRLSRLTPILQVPHPLALYRMHHASITRSVPARNYKGEVIERALSRWGYVGTDGRTASSSAVARALARTWSDFATSHLLAGDAPRARRAVWSALRSVPTYIPAWKVLVKSCLPTPRTDVA